VTDSYLLALACAHGGKLATFDRRLVVDAVRGEAKGLHLIG
jgi:predicted nucleic acid-binding protein